MRALEALGRPAYLAVPNGYHRLVAPAYKQRYPQLVVLAPRGSTAKVAKKVPVDGAYEDMPADAAVSLQAMPGTGELEGYLRVRDGAGTSVVLGDCVFDMDLPKDFMGRLILRTFGSAPGPRISRLFKLIAVKDRGALRAELERIAALPDLAQLVIAHDKLSSGADAARVLREALIHLR